MTPPCLKSWEVRLPTPLTENGCCVCCSMLVVNIMVALITLTFLTHAIACLWYMIACPEHICYNEAMNDIIAHESGISTRLLYDIALAKQCYCS